MSIVAKTAILTHIRDCLDGDYLKKLTKKLTTKYIHACKLKYKLIINSVKMKSFSLISRILINFKKIHQNSYISIDVYSDIRYYISAKREAPLKEKRKMTNTITYKELLEKEEANNIKKYKDFGTKHYVGFSDIATLSLIGCKLAEERTSVYGEGLKCKFIAFGEDGDYDCYIISDHIEVPLHYAKVETFASWVRIVDDQEVMYTLDSNYIDVYRAGERGFLIQLRSNQSESLELSNNARFALSTKQIDLIPEDTEGEKTYTINTLTSTNEGLTAQEVEEFLEQFDQDLGTLGFLLAQYQNNHINIDGEIKRGEEWLEKFNQDELNQLAVVEKTGADYYDYDLKIMEVK